MKYQNEIKIGLTVVLAILVAYFGFRFMSDVPLLRQSHEIVTTFDRVDGLTAGSIVYMNGVKIGSVKGIDLNPDYSVSVTLSIDLETSIPTGSIAYLTSAGLLDGKTIVIERGSSNEPVAYGGEIEGVYVDSMMETLAESGEVLGNEVADSFTELQQFLRRLNSTLNDESSTSVHSSIQNVESATRQVSELLEESRADLENTIASANSVMSRLDTLTADNQPRIDSLMTHLETTLGNLTTTSREMNSSLDQLQQILNKVNAGEGTAGRLVNDPSLYNNIDSLSIELRTLIQDLTENPGRYLRHVRLVEVF